MEILLVNHRVQNCGVYQYGKRVASILQKSTRNNYTYCEVESAAEFYSYFEKFTPSIIINNHTHGTMPWLEEEIVGTLKSQGIKHGLLVHNTGYANFFDFYLHQDPNYVEGEIRNFSILRPLFDLQQPPELPTSPIRIGSFGFGFKVKHFDDLCRLIRREFRGVEVEVNLHITESYFSPNQDFIENIKEKCRKILKAKNFRINFTHDFLSDMEMLQFLQNNHCNVFFYEKYKSYNGISSTIDYAISSGRPIAVNSSNMFSHLRAVKPSVFIEELSLRQIIDNGYGGLQFLASAWSNNNFIDRMDEILDSI